MSSSHDDGTSPTGDVPSSRVAPVSRRVRLLIAVLSLLLVLIAGHGFVLETFTVPSGSMEPTLAPGDRILIRKVGVDVRRGDVIVFDARSAFGVGSEPGPARRFAERWGFRADGAAYVKRVVGLGGDRISMDSRGVVRRNGRVLNEPYLHRVPTDTPFDIEVPAGRVFVLGDNRAASEDSRNHLGDPGGGSVPVGDVIGTVIGRYWPVSRAGGIETAPAERPDRTSAASSGRGVPTNTQPVLAR